jgi:acetyltransferase-like isoleucine patch superfamily enzyme
MVMDCNTPFIHPTADVSPQADVSPGARIWHRAQVRERVRIGANSIIGKDVYVDFDVIIGDNVKIQNGVYVYHGVTVEDGVFLGPGAILTNDKLPRAINPDGTLKTGADWEVSPILIRRGASIGANAVILPGVTVGEFAMVGAGAIVTRDVPAHGLVYGNPASLHGFVCRCGRPLKELENHQWKCEVCNESYTL